MDKLLYIAMSGAKQNMQALSINANNLANAKTTGFKADLAQARSMQAFGEGQPSRVFSMTERASQNFEKLTMRGMEMYVKINNTSRITKNSSNTTSSLLIAWLSQRQQRLQHGNEVLAEFVITELGCLGSSRQLHLTPAAG